MIGLDHIGFEKGAQTDRNKNQIKVKQLGAIFGSFLVFMDSKILHFKHVRIKNLIQSDLTQIKPESLLFFIEFRQKRTLKSRIKFNFSAAENSANQSYCSLCVP